MHSGKLGKDRYARPGCWNGICAQGYLGLDCIKVFPPSIRVTPTTKDQGEKGPAGRHKNPYFGDIFCLISLCVLLYPSLPPTSSYFFLFPYLTFTVK